MSLSYLKNTLFYGTLLTYIALPILSFADEERTLNAGSSSPCYGLGEAASIIRLYSLGTGTPETITNGDAINFDDETHYPLSQVDYSTDLSSVTILRDGVFLATFMVSQDSDIIVTLGTFNLQLNGIDIEGSQYRDIPLGGKRVPVQRLALTGQAMFTAFAGDVLTLNNVSDQDIELNGSLNTVNASLLVQRLGDVSLLT